MQQWKIDEFAFLCAKFERNVSSHRLGSQLHMPDRTQAVKQLRVQATALEASITDPAAKAAMQKLAEELRYSDPISCEATKDAETILAGRLAQLKAEADPKKQLAIIDEARLILGQRNTAAKQGKNKG